MSRKIKVAIAGQEKPLIHFSCGKKAVGRILLDENSEELKRRIP